MTGVAVRRVAAVLAATLSGGALTAYLVLPHDAAVTDGTAAGLRVPSMAAAASSSTPSPMPSLEPSGPTSPGAATTAVPVAPATQAPQLQEAEPTRVVVARLGIDMSVAAQGVDELGEMALPKNPAVAGWYRFGSAPADDSGAVVLAAHIDSKTLGVGPFVRLGSARAGDEVQVWVGATKVIYRVSQVARVDKAQLDGDRLFATTGPARLHLVTCTGDYVKGSGYQQNLVVVADRVPSGLPGQG